MVLRRRKYTNGLYDNDFTDTNGVIRSRNGLNDNDFTDANGVIRSRNGL